MYSRVMGPEWFFGVDVVFELLFAIVAIAVAMYAFHVYKVTQKRIPQIFGISFLLIGSSYAIQSLFNFLIISELAESVSEAMHFHSVWLLEAIGMFAHMIFMTAGLVLLLYMTFKTEKASIYWAILITAWLAIVMSLNSMHIFFLLSSLFLLFITMFYIENYRTKRITTSLLVAIAFTLLMLSKIIYVLSIIRNPFFYAVGHFFELFAYIFILWNFVLVRKR